MPRPSASSLKQRTAASAAVHDAKRAKVLADARAAAADLLLELVDKVPTDTWDTAAAKGHSFVNLTTEGIGIRQHIQSGAYPDGNPRMVNLANLIQDRRKELPDGVTALELANLDLADSGLTLICQFHGGKSFTTHGGPNKGKTYNGGLLIHCTWDLHAYEAYQQEGRERRAKSRAKGPTQTLDEYKRGVPLKARSGGAPAQ